MTNRERVEIGERLCKALEEPPEEFERELCACPNDEYPARWESSDGASVSGTVLTVAAARGKTEHMKLLLRRGWDVNSAGFAAEEALAWHGCLESFLTIADEFGAAAFGEIAWRRDGDVLYNPEAPRPRPHDYQFVARATPLAAAILCGRAEAVCLLRENGAYNAESSAVAAVTVMVLRFGKPAQKECVRLAFDLPPDAGADEVLRTRALPMRAFADICTPEQLRARLSGLPCEPEDVRAAARLMTKGSGLSVNVLEPEKKLLALSEAYPDLFREGEMLDTLLWMALLGGYYQKSPLLLERWQALAGRRRNVTRALPFLCGDSVLCKRLCEGGGELYLEAEQTDLVRLGCGEIREGEPDAVAELLDDVEVKRTTDRGISVFAATVLESGDVGLIVKAAKSGALRGEPRDELLAFAEQRQLGILPRALMLALPNDGRARSALPAPPRGSFWSSRWQGVTKEEAETWLALAWLDPSLSVEECKERIWALRNDLGFPLSRRDYGIEPWPEFDPIRLAPFFVEDIRVESLCAAACCGGNANLLRALLEEMPELPYQLLESDETNPIYQGRQIDRMLRASPLALAAAAHAEAQVRPLLSLGFDPLERDMPIRSHFLRREGGVTYVSPEELAKLYGDEDGAERIVRLLGGN